MKEYVGKYPVNKALTKKLGVEDFKVYRDPEVGLYAYSETRDMDINLGVYNESAKTVSNMTIDEWKQRIEANINDDRCFRENGYLRVTAL